MPVISCHDSTIINFRFSQGNTTNLGRSKDIQICFLGYKFYPQESSIFNVNNCVEFQYIKSSSKCHLRGWNYSRGLLTLLESSSSFFEFRNNPAEFHLNFIFIHFHRVIHSSTVPNTLTSHWNTSTSVFFVVLSPRDKSGMWSSQKKKKHELWVIIGPFYCLVARERICHRKEFLLITMM